MVGQEGKPKGSQEGRHESRQEGKQEGRQEGRQEGKHIQALEGVCPPKLPELDSSRSSSANILYPQSRCAVPTWLGV